MPGAVHRASAAPPRTRHAPAPWWSTCARSSDPTASRAPGDLAGRSGSTSVSRWIAGGRLQRPLPHVVVLPECAERWRTRALAAVLSTGGALSHASALTAHGLAPEDGRGHVSIDARRRAPARTRLLTVHRVTGLSALRVEGLPVSPLARALVDAWGQAHGGRRGSRDQDVARAAVITER